ncbi:hypothetical protein ScPMuIL_004161 [Solemya velum]
MLCRRHVEKFKSAVFRLTWRRCSVTRLLIVAVAICAFSIFYLSYRLVATQTSTRTQNPPRPSISCRDGLQAMRHNPNDHTLHSNFRTGKKVLVLVESPYSDSAKSILNTLEAVRMDYKVETVWKNLPMFTHHDKGKFSVVVFESLVAYTRLDSWNRQIMDKYCKDYGVGMIMFVQPMENVGTDYVSVLGFPLELQQNIRLKDYQLDTTSSIWRITRPGEIIHSVPGDDWTVFHSNHSSYQPLAKAVLAQSFWDDQEYIDDNMTVVPVVRDCGLIDNIQRVLFGHGLDFWLHHLLFLDSLSFLSGGKLSLSLDRYIQVDIDDIFVGQTGIRMEKPDVEALIDAQTRLQSQVPGFHFNLGFSGYYYKHGSEAENEGDEYLIKNSNKFWWFDHMFQHEQAHKRTLEELEKSMLKSYAFAKEHNIVVSQQYAVAPHHSGVYPVHDSLYDAWKNVWDMRVTSTEEYPRLHPFWRRRGFIHRGIMVLPRMTCGLFTHTIMMENYPGGKEHLDHSIQGGELFETIIYNPVNIYMTHLSNYGNDRLALYTFESVVKFVQCWTNLKLQQVLPMQLAFKYFDLFPEEKEPIWQNPCSYKRHIEIWATSKDCNRLPKFLVIGPQKTGTTALYTFLAMHPAIMSNYPSPETFEEVQFFNGKNYIKGLDWYMEFFPIPNNATSDFLFEKSATYFDNERVPMRAHALLPKAKIICILINPAKRAYSWYQHMKSHQDATALNYTFYEVITATEDAPSSLLDLKARCLQPGLYVQHLLRWLDYFPTRQLFIIDGEQLRSDPVLTMTHVQRFLHIQPLYNYSQSLRYDPKKGFFCQVVSEEKNKCLGRGKGRVYLPMEPASDEYLRQYYKQDNIALSKLLLRLNHRVPQWLQEELRN